jgi:hypothetical protein
MKPRFWLIMVCWALAYLLFSLGQQAGLYHPLKVSGSNQRLDRCREQASGSPTASIVKSTHFDPSRAGPRTSLVLEDAWTERDIGPPGQETHGPPEPIGNLPVAGQRRQLKETPGHLTQEIFDSSRRNLKNQGFATAFS